MDRIDLLITQSRSNSANEEYTDSTGIPQSSFLAWANTAQRRIQTKILEAYPKALNDYIDVAVNSGDSEFSIPTRTFLGTRIERVEFSPTGLEKDFYQLHPISPVGPRCRINHSPQNYFRERGKICLDGPSSKGGVLRVFRQVQVARLDLRRAIVASATVGATQLTALSFETEDLIADNQEAMEEQGYITIVDKDGAILMDGIAISSIDIDTGVVTLDPHTFTAGQTCPVGAYACSGKRATTHSELMDVCEDAIVLYMQLRALRRDASDENMWEAEELQDLMADIVTAYSHADEEISDIPIVDMEYGCLY